MGKPGLKKVHRYSVEFKLTAVKLSHMPGVEVQAVANALDIHPFMLSRWRKEVRDGELVGKVAPIDAPAVAELKRLREVELQYKRLRMEHDLLKKAIRFASDRKQKSLRSSRQTGARTRSK